MLSRWSRSPPSPLSARTPLLSRGTVLSCNWSHRDTDHCCSEYESVKERKSQVQKDKDKLLQEVQHLKRKVGLSRKT